MKYSKREKSSCSSKDLYQQYQKKFLVSPTNLVVLDGKRPGAQHSPLLLASRVLNLEYRFMVFGLRRSSVDRSVLSRISTD